ncbi:hypothetical protein CC80DRAFT_287094 [Byssothecium circinans]|uniref:Uncharacterized protein n=1 Tax=Byssothecium circinans TaxID=147558 RepID=A0A6A5U855_9PLEO|nr:hypothetical protein CC80DRAFT_287094 [Byssothecium circinans]
MGSVEPCLLQIPCCNNNQHVIANTDEQWICSIFEDQRLLRVLSSLFSGSWSLILYITFAFLICSAFACIPYVARRIRDLLTSRVLSVIQQGNDRVKDLGLGRIGLGFGTHNLVRVAYDPPS